MSLPTLPNYFLADLPPETPMPAPLIREACETLRRNRARFLVPRRTESIISVLVDLGRQWLAPYSPWMAEALERGPSATGFSAAVLEEGLRTFFKRLTARSLDALVRQDLGHLSRIEGLTANDAEGLAGVLSQARGPELLVHITGGVLPTPVFTAILHGLLVRSAQFVKCASGTSLLPRLFAHSVRDLEPKIASCLELVDWKGGQHPGEEILFSEAQCVVASGRDETLDQIRRALPGRVRFVPHGHRVSAGYITREALQLHEESRTVAAAAVDVAAWNQLGCLSPHVLYVETGGLLPPEDFAARLAEELGRLEGRLPRGPVDAETSASIHQRREFYRVRAAADDRTQCWFSPDSTAWSVVYEADGRFQVSCLNRFIYVKAVDTPADCLHQAEEVRGQWSTVGLAAVGDRVAEVAQEFANWGVTRICPLGRMQDPPLTWRHDGRPVLGDLVTWTGHELPPEG